jgi:hypothetical protein
MIYPYSYGRFKTEKNPDATEDFGHGGFDGRSLEFLYESGRYPHFAREQVQHLADTVAYSCKGPGSFTVAVHCLRTG